MGKTANASMSKDRLETLDLLRGLAAFAILARHFPWPDGAVLLLERSYLGVDLFFTLSGFVIAYSYQHRLEAGMPVGRYVLARLVRLYPLYILATVLGAAQAAIPLLLGDSTAGFGSWGLTLATAAMFLPTPSDWSLWPRALFPLNFVAWSLFFELAANILYGLLAKHLSNRLLAAVIAAGALLLALSIAQTGSLDVGADWSTARWGLGRALFSFFLGVAVYRSRERFRLPKMPAWLLATALLAALLPPAEWHWRYDLFCIGLLFPVLVWAAADASAGNAMSGVSRQLGFLSYPIYALQIPLIHTLRAVLDRGFGVQLEDWTVGGLLLQFGFVATISWAIARWFDTPVRGRLNRSLLLGPTQTQAQTAP